VTGKGSPAGSKHETEQGEGKDLGRKRRKCSVPSNGKCAATRRVATFLE